MNLPLFATPLINHPNLQGYYPLEDTWNDFLGANNLTANNTPTFVTGKFGKGGSFASASSQSATVNAFEYTGSFTWHCWFNRTSGTDGAIMSKTKNDGSVLRRIYINASQEVVFTVDGLGAGSVSATSAATSTGTTYFACAVFDADNDVVKLWINGTKVETTGATGTATSLTSDFALGKDGGYSNYFNGWIDDAAIYNAALSDTEVQNYYTGNYRKGGTYTSY